MNGFGSPYLSMTDGQFPLNLEGGDDSEDPLYQRGVRAVLNAVMNRPGGPEGFGTSAQRFTPAELAAPSAFPGSDARPISSVAGNRQSAPIRSAGAGSSVTGPIGSPTRNVNSAADFSREDRRFAQQETKAAASSGSGPAAPASPTPAEPRTTFHAPFANGEFDIGGEVPDTGEPGRDPVGEFVAHVPAGVVQQIVENPGEALRNAGRGVAGIAKGIPNAVSEGVAQAGLGYRYLLAAMGEKRGIYPPGTLDNLIASNEGRAPGRLFQYGSDAEAAGGMAGGFMLPAVPALARGAAATAGKVAGAMADYQPVGTMRGQIGAIGDVGGPLPRIGGESAELSVEAPASAPSTSSNVTRSGARRNPRQDWRRIRDSWDDLGYNEILSDGNRVKIAQKKSPIVDESWVKVFPEDGGLMGETIAIHHIDGKILRLPWPKTRHYDAHQPGGYGNNPGGPGAAAPFYPAELEEDL